MAAKAVEAATRVEQPCALCTLPIRIAVPSADQNDKRVFCCDGCRNVWRILVESGKLEGLDDPRESQLYIQALAAGLIGGGATLPSPLSRSAKVSVESKGGTLDDNRQCVLTIGGMWCSSCSWLIEQTLMRTRGVVSADVSFSSDTASIIYKPAKTDETVLAKAVGILGYDAAPMGEGNDADPRTRSRRRDLVRVAFCLAFAMNAMMTQLILYAGFFEGMSRDVRRGVPWLLLAFSIPVFIAATPLFYRAVKAAESRVATMETLVSLGAVTALGYSIWQTVVGSGHVYYDTADMLLALVMAGKYIESGARHNAGDALGLLYGLIPKKAVIVRGDNEMSVAISQIGVGDLILVKAGERVAADGVVIGGSGTIDESLLSGESRPVNKRSGDRAVGGTILMNGLLTVQVDRVRDESSLAQIINHVEVALRRKTPAEQMADRISRVFVPVVLFIAVATGAVLTLFLHGDADTVMTRVVAILVIACPCALGIATPMAISAGISAAARYGILVADGAAFESLRKVTDIVLDKTGTVTEAAFVVVRSLGGEDSMALLNVLESQSGHPIAKAILAISPVTNVSGKDIFDFRVDEGLGISGTILGRRLFAGNERAVAAAGLSLNYEQEKFAKDCFDDGLTVIYWGIAKERVIGVLSLGDTVRPGVDAAIAELRLLGILTQLLSGDSQAATAFVADRLSITNFLGAVTPSEKADLVEKLRQSGKRVCMVGDGVNDAPALAQADVGVALASGTDIAARTAQVTLLTPDLLLLPRLIKLSHRTIDVMRLNLFWAFLYNIVCIPLAVLGYITPLWAVSAMVFSSITVILNTQRLGKA